MCGRYTVLTEDEIIEARELLRSLSLRIVRDELVCADTDGGDVNPTNMAPVITQEPDGIALESLKWGFKPWQSKGVIFNARAESLAEKRMFAPHLKTRRCVVPAGSFYEWLKNGNVRIKHTVRDPSGSILFFAGLYREMDGVREFVIITKSAVGELASIHDRSPVVLQVDLLEAWLSGALPSDVLQELAYPLLCHVSE